MANMKGNQRHLLEVTLQIHDTSGNRSFYMSKIYYTSSRIVKKYLRSYYVLNSTFT